MPATVRPSLSVLIVTWNRHEPARNEVVRAYSHHTGRLRGRVEVERNPPPSWRP